MTDLDYNIDNILCDFPSCLRKNIEDLCLRSQIGLSSVSLQDISILPKGFNAEDTILSNYHFIIKIPYAGKRLKWEVIFDPEDYHFAPDFDFNDDQFLNNPDFKTILDNVPSLADWNLTNPKALSQVLNEFLLLYKKIQVEKLFQENIYSRYRDEYQSLIANKNGVQAENVEVNMEPNTIHFLISLKVDCTSLPEFIQPSENDHANWCNPGEDFAHLKVSILKLDGTRSNITLQLSPRLEQVLGSSRELDLPDFKKESTLADYVTLVLKMIDNRVEAVADHFRMKKIYIMSLVAARNCDIIEYDTETYNKAVFMYNINDYYCLVTVTIGAKFPHERPSVHLSSIYCQEGRQCNENIDKYPYHPTFQPNENIDRLLEFLFDPIVRFKNHRH